MAWKFFKLSEFDCKHCGQNLMQSGFIDKLDELREEVGFPLRITSGYRCPQHNMAVSTTGPNGPHTTGRAADIGVDRARALLVLKAALDIGFTGIGIQQKGASRFIHLDELEFGRPTIWSY